jgi:RHS repeat-associated protein
LETILKGREGLAAAFTGKPWDAAAQMYYFPYRWYSPSAARWLTRDPLGMVDGPNVYGYVRGMPINLIDEEGTVVQVPVIAWEVGKIIALAFLLYFGYKFIKAGKECFDAVAQFRSEVRKLKNQGEFRVCEDIFDSAKNEQKRYEEAAAIGALPGFQKVMNKCPKFITSAYGPRS